MGALLCSALALALLLAPPAASADEVIKIGGPAVEGMFLTTHFEEEGVTTPAGRRYAAEYRRKFAKALAALGALGYDAYNVALGTPSPRPAPWTARQSPRPWPPPGSAG